MSTSRRAFIRDMSAGLAAAGTAASSLACSSGTSPAEGGSERLLVRDPDHVEPAPVGHDRLPLQWHQQRTRLLKERAAADHGAAAVVLGSDQNMVYFWGMQEFIYHRPGHGQGQFLSGHQPPFIALGDDTVLAEGMTFSMEPGLYDARNGIGINPSDNLRVTSARGVRFSSVPFSKEWSFLSL